MGNRELQVNKFDLSQSLLLGGDEKTVLTEVFFDALTSKNVKIDEKAIGDQFGLNPNPDLSENPAD